MCSFMTRSLATKGSRGDMLIPQEGPDRTPLGPNLTSHILSQGANSVVC